MSSSASDAVAGTSVANGTARITQFIEFRVLSGAESLTVELSSYISKVEQFSGSNGQFSANSFLSTVEGFNSHGFRNFSGVTVPGTFSTELNPGTYRLRNITFASSTVQDSGGRAQAVFENSVSFTNASFGEGSTEANPVLPDRPPGNDRTWEFIDGRSGLWFDPELAHGYDFATTDGSLFRTILGLPTGFDEKFEIHAEGTLVGTFGSADSVDFNLLFGHGLSEFQIRGIKPGTDPDDPTAFPIQLAFNRDTASFTMKAADVQEEPTEVTEPSTLLCMAGSTFALVLSGRVRRSRFFRFS